MDILSSMSICYWTLVGIALFVLKFTATKALSVRAAFELIRDCPGRMMEWVEPLSALSLALGNTFPRPGMIGYWGAKFSLYKKFGATCFASVGLSPTRPYFWLADSEAIKLVTLDRNTFKKDVLNYQIIDIYGKNVVSLEGSDWKRHRSVAMSAFNEANIALVWSETLHLLDEWFEQLDAIGTNVAVNLVRSMTQVTLFIISAAGFGVRMSWTADSESTNTELPPDCKLTFQSAVVNSVHNIVFRALIPRWFYRLPSFIKLPYFSSRALSTQLAFSDLQTHMLNLVASARADMMSGKREHGGASGEALLRNLVEANMNQDGDAKRLTDGELLSNIFTFLLAGHETSAHMLCFVFVYLALYPACQQKLYEEVIRVWSPDVPVIQITANHKEYMNKLEYTTACIRETLRIIPVVPRLPRKVCTDTVLPGTSFAPGPNDTLVETGKFSMAIPAGSTIIIDIWGLHMNPLYWGDDAAEFKPERFVDTESHQWPRHAYAPFLIGARSCIGQRFALTEMICILASVVRRYQIMVPDDLARKPLSEQKEVLLKWTSGVTLTPMNARVKFVRRE